MEWTTEQVAIIEAPVTARLLVDAGPGTGKTAVVCARLAYLLNAGAVSPTEVWLVSFTKTAVHELRARIAKHLNNPGTVAALRIATIDSHAWAINSGFNANASLSGDFEESIEGVISLIKSHEGVFEYLSSVRHLIVDEAQDVVGARCELLLELIEALPPEAGVTVMSDAAQSIYGFAEDVRPQSLGGTLPVHIRESFPAFEVRDLSEIHRTNDPVLLRVFGDGRKRLLKAKGTGSSKLAAIRALLEERNHESLGSHRDDLKALPAELADTFLLFRRRGEALEASAYLGLRQHRLRLSGLPTVVRPWIGMILSDWTAPEIDRAQFTMLWATRMGAGREKEGVEAWALLVRFFGLSGTRISVSACSTRLSRASIPIELTLPDFGSSGPVVGTIHGAKGREAHQVRLYLPPSQGDERDDDDLAEEARILYVGATRAREKLCIGTAATKALARRLDPSGRAFTPYPYSKGKSMARAAVEIGKNGDVDAEGLVGRRFFASKDSATTAQKRLLATDIEPVETGARLTGPELNWRYFVGGEDDAVPYCFLSPSLNYDLFEIAKEVDKIVHLRRNNPPGRFRHVRILGLRTMALAADDPKRELLHSPWRESGILLAPLLTGYDMAYFR